MEINGAFALCEVAVIRCIVLGGTSAVITFEEVKRRPWEEVVPLHSLFDDNLLFVRPPAARTLLCT